jgi:predicted homoserine dehydrogenase-like protein
MNYHRLFRSDDARRIRVALIGVGDFGATLLDQAQNIDRIDITVICDKDEKRMKDAIRTCGLVSPPMTVTDITADGLPDFDVLVEATGQTEAAASIAEWAISKGRHVVMASKEAGIVVGPILSRLAKEKGVVYTEVEGDQPSLLIGLNSWAETLGLEVLAAGKSSEYDFVLEDDDTLCWLEHRHQQSGMRDLWECDDGDWQRLVEKRNAVVANAAFPRRTVADFCELGVVANGTGLVPDRAALHAPLLRPVELADAFQAQSDGGLLANTKVIDVFNCLRRPDEMSFAGGVFVIVRCNKAKTWDLLRGKGHVVARNTKTAMLFIGQHTLGVEAPMSILSAVLLNLPTGASNPQPNIDLIARAARDFKQGETLHITDPHHHAVAGLEPELVSAERDRADSPVPYYMATDRTLLADVKKGTVLTWSMVDTDKASRLYQLRRQQNAQWHQ